MKEYKNIKTFDDLIELEHGKIGTETRNKYEEGAQMYTFLGDPLSEYRLWKLPKLWLARLHLADVSEMLKTARKEANMRSKSNSLKSQVQKRALGSHFKD